MGKHHLPETETGSTSHAASLNATFRWSVAPMLDVTDRHYRAIARMLTPTAVLYSEMYVAQTLIHGDVPKHLATSNVTGPVALQLATNKPDDLVAAIRIAEPFGYNEVNLNVGCPSDRVKAGEFGACLMNDPALVAELVAAAKDVATVPVTVKHRTGVDDNDSLEQLLVFAETVTAAGADALIVHARKAWLSGLSPKQNRTVPPLMYDRVHALKAALPEQHVELNGGLQTIAEARDAAAGLNGAMLGRAAWHNPLVLTHIEPDDALTGIALLAQAEQYLLNEVAAGTPLLAVTKRLIPLFTGWPGARSWRRVLTEAHVNGHNPETLIADASVHLPAERLAEPLHA